MRAFTRYPVMLVVIALVFALSACAQIQQATSTPATVEAKSQEPQVDYVGKMSLTPNHGPAGTVVSVQGEGLPPDTDFDLVWNTVKGSWDIQGEQNEEYHGRIFDPITVPLDKLKSDSKGNLEATFTVPEGFGFFHDVTLVSNDVIRNKAGFSVDLQAAFSPSSGPVGTPITIDLSGYGWQNLENSWTVLYDNRFTGFLSAVTTNGRATAVIPAVGQPGKHVIQLIHGSFQYPFMNMQQSPRPDRPSFTFEFTVTDGEAVLPPPADEQKLASEASPEPADTNDPIVWTDLANGTVGTSLTLKGRNLPVSQDVRLMWSTVEGNRVSGSGWSESSSELATVSTATDGTLEYTFEVPDDLGGDHTIAVVSGDDTALAKTSFKIQPSAFAIEPASGPAGTPFTVHIKGVGWTETANIYTLVYDNGYEGYACGFNSGGDITIHMQATGEPGWHYIDLYPAIYKGKEVSGTQNFRIPQLTFADDHPGEQLPAFHFAFLVTP